MKTLLQLNKDAETVCNLVVELTTSHLEKLVLLRLVEYTITTVITDDQCQHLRKLEAMKK